METIKIKLSNYDRLLQVKQNSELKNLNYSNQQLLQQSIQQNKQFEQLNQQIEQANQLNKQILQNQISEIQKKEEQKFYKSLAFNINELISELSKIENDILLYYFVGSYHSKIQNSLDLSIEKLDEINDKIFAKELLKQFEIISENAKSKKDIFNNSPLANFDKLFFEYKTIKNQIDQKHYPTYIKQNLEIKLNYVKLYNFLFYGFGVFIFILFRDWFMSFLSSLITTISLPLIVVILVIIFELIKKKMKKEYSEYLLNQNKLIEIENEKERKQMEETNELIKYDKYILETHPIHDKIIEVENKFPKFSAIAMKLSQIEDNFTKKW